MPGPGGPRRGRAPQGCVLDRDGQHPFSAFAAGDQTAAAARAFTSARTAAALVLLT
ncbi:hypothetical protein ACFPM0_37420 [Pseudonocardia sulfidoxydans]|uniref:hypothetical protein n=1 Tax=Pseudonocardia sulfidoxydans TaxID=54011 RepID=UPI0036194B96